MQLLSLHDECGNGSDYTRAMNRIAELREAAKLTQEQLAELCGTTGNTISRLENGRTKLSQDWMIVIARALKVRPADLIDTVALAEADGQDVEPTDTDPQIAIAIGRRGLHIYRVTGRSVMETGLAPGKIITVDESDTAIQARKMGDVVLVEVGPKRHRLLMQYMPPGLLLTNRPGANFSINVEDPAVAPQIIGVVIPD